MASIFKRGRWVDADGKHVPKDTPGAEWRTSRYYMIQLTLSGRRKFVKGYTDRKATEQLAARLKKAHAQGLEGLEDPYKEHRRRDLSEHVADWVGELKQVSRSVIYVGLCTARLTRLIFWSTPSMETHRR